MDLTWGFIPRWQPAEGETAIQGGHEKTPILTGTGSRHFFNGHTSQLLCSLSGSGEKANLITMIRIQHPTVERKKHVYR